MIIGAFLEGKKVKKTKESLLVEILIKQKLE